MNTERKQHQDSKRLKKELQELLEQKMNQNTALQKVLEELRKVPDNDS